MNTYCDDCKRCTGGNMRKTDVPGGDDHNRCHECEAALQGKIADLEAQLYAAKNAIVGYVKCFKERDALRERCEEWEWLRQVERFCNWYRDNGAPMRMGPGGYAELCRIEQAALAATEVKP